MRKYFLCALLITAALFLSFGEAEAKLPRDYQEFKARYQTKGKTMEGAAHLYFEAVFCYLNEETRDEASKMLRYAMYLPLPLEQSNNNRTFVSRMKDPSFHYIFRSFAAGTSPENSYAMSPDDFKLIFTSKRPESDFYHLFVRSTGADSPRSIWMQKKDGLWYVINNASTYAEVRKPAAAKVSKHAHDADYDEPGQFDEPESENDDDEEIEIIKW